MVQRTVIHFICRFSYLPGLAGVLLLILGCSGIAPPPKAPPGHPKPYQALGQWYQPVPDSKGFRQQGVASWYGEQFHGRKTSSGEPYDMNAMTAAHKTLPLGTEVRVRNLENDREIDVRINDRGPFVRERIIDLSVGAAKAIGIHQAGTAPVEIVALGPSPETTPVSASSAAPRPIDYFSGNFTIQIGAFSDKTNAEKLIQQLEQTYKSVHMVPFFDGARTWYRVRVGRSNNLQKALEYETHMIQNGFPDAFVVAE
ncbi:MAG: septal ring lytic transglycosylase RlpA family protein [Pseudomonadota bacterium]